MERELGFARKITNNTAKTKNPITTSTRHTYEEDIFN
jgi:hypothetical protein